MSIPNENLYHIQRRPKNDPDAKWLQSIFHYSPNPLGRQLILDKLKKLRELFPEIEFRPILKVVTVEEYVIDEDPTVALVRVA